MADKSYPDVSSMLAGILDIEFANQESKDRFELFRAYCKRLEEDSADCRAAIKTLRDYARETFDYWESDQDSKVGKRLKAMAGMLPIYDAEITKALELVESEKGD